MAELDNSVVSNLTDAVNGVRTWLQNNSSRLGATNAGGAMPANTVGQWASDFVEQLKNAGIAALNFGTAVDSIGKNLNTVGVDQFRAVANKLGGLAGVGEVTDKLGGEFGRLYAQTLKNNDIGLGQNQLYGLEKEFIQLQVSTADYSQSLARSRGALNSFGQTSDDTARQFAKSMQDVESSGLGKQLLDTGQFTRQQMFELGVMAQYGRTKSLDNAEAISQNTNFVGELSDSINKQAILYGKSRTAMVEEVEERLRQPQVLAQLRGATEEQREAIIKTQVALAGMGKSVGDAADEIMSGGPLSQDTMTTMMAMGQKGMQEFMEGQQLIKAGRVEEGNAMLARAKADTAAYQSTDQFRMLLRTAPDDLKAGINRATQDMSQAMGSTMAAVNNGVGATAADRLKNQEVMAQNLSAGRKPTGELNLEATPVREANQANYAAISNQVAVTNKLTNELTTLVNKSENIDAFGKALNLVFGNPGDLTRATENIRNASTTLKDIVNPTVQTPQHSASAPAHASGGIIQGPELAVIAEKGPEAVIPLDQLKNFMPDVSKMSMPNPADMFKQMQDPMANMMKDMAPELQRQLQGSVSQIVPPKFPEMPNISMAFEKAKEEASKASEAELRASGRDRLPGANTSVESPKSKEAKHDETMAQGVSLKDLNDQLIKLNTNIVKMISHTEHIKDASVKTANNSSRMPNSRSLV